MEKYGNINNLISEIHKQTDDVNSNVIKEAEEFHNEKIKQVKRDAEIRKRRILKEAGKKGEEIKQCELSNLRIEINKIKLLRRNQMMNQVILMIQHQLMSMRKQKDYITLLKSLFKEALEVLKEDNLNVVFDKDDEKIIDQKMKDDFINISNEYNLKLDNKAFIFQKNIGQGLVIKVKDKNLIYNNTIEAKLHRLKQDIDYDIYKELFE